MKGCVNMEDLLFLLIATLISLFYDFKTRQPEMQTTEAVQNIYCYESPQINTADLIKNRLLWTYHGEVSNKREKIVSLLLQLEKLEDTDIFFVKYDYIREYIFNST